MNEVRFDPIASFKEAIANLTDDQVKELHAEIKCRLAAEGSEHGARPQYGLPRTTS